MTAQMDSLVKVVGRGTSAYATILMKTGPIGTHNLRQLVFNLIAEIKKIDFGTQVVSRATPEGMALDVVIEEESDLDQLLLGITDFCARLERLERTRQQPVTSPAELTDMIVFGTGESPELASDLLAKAPIFVAVTAGRSSHRNPQEYARVVQERLSSAFGDRRTDMPVATSITSIGLGGKRRWIQLPQQSSSLVRWYRLLAAPVSREQALARSVGNACVGGTPTSRIFRSLSEQHKYSYNPSIFLRQVNGGQWMVLDAATGPEFEVIVDTEIEALFRSVNLDPPQEAEIRSAARYMFSQRRIMDSSPHLANLAALAQLDGSDPWSLTSVTPDEVLNLSPELIASELANIYDASAATRLIVSPHAEPEVWAAS